MLGKSVVYILSKELGRYKEFPLQLQISVFQFGKDLLAITKCFVHFNKKPVKQRGRFYSFSYCEVKYSAWLIIWAGTKANSAICSILGPPTETIHCFNRPFEDIDAIRIVPGLIGPVAEHDCSAGT